MNSMSDIFSARLTCTRARQPSEPSRLRELGAFGSNPGALGAYVYVPAGLSRNAPLVVVLHGCTQTPDGYDHGSGWSSLADAHGFALLFPEQQRANNANLCFNWFEPGHQRRDAGEPGSIAQMVEAMVARHGLDPARVYVTGLSAGGAMAAVLLATYPDLFAGGAVIGGLPFGAATSMPQAFEAMRGQRLPRPPALAAKARAGAGHEGPWPTLSVWHGSADGTVAPANADALIGQWALLHGATPTPQRTEQVGVHRRLVWQDAAGRDVLEAYAIEGMGHGTPLAAGGPEALGNPGAYMLEAGISSTREIARFWGLLARDAARAPEAAAEQGTPEQEAHAGAAYPLAVLVPLLEDAGPKPADGADNDAAPRGAAGRSDFIHRTIEDALRKAGLMR